MSKICGKCGFMAEDKFYHCPMCGAVLPQPMMNQSNGAYVDMTLKSRLVAGLLGIFLGSWGVHNFYLGYTTKGVIQILVTIFTFGLGSIWGLLEGILILSGNIQTDGQGRPLRY